MKTTLAALLAYAKGHGYAGKEDDAKAICAFCASKNLPITDTTGKALPASAWSEVEIDTPPAPTPFAVSAAAEPPKPAKAIGFDEPPADIDAKIAARVESTLKGLGISIVNGRPKLIDDGSTKIAAVKSGHQLRFEDKIARKQTGFKTFDEAYGYAMWALGTFDMSGTPSVFHEIKSKALEKWGQTDVGKTAYATTPVNQGGALVPNVYDWNIINLVKTAGVARRICRNVEMESDKVFRPKVTGTHTVYYPVEGGTLTDSNQTWAQETLEAKTGHVLVKFSIQLLDDSVVDIMDHATNEAARAIGRIEDDSLFTGDGNGAGGVYGSIARRYIPGVQGICNIFGSSALSNSRSYIGGDTADATTLTQLTQAMGLLPDFARGSPAFHCSPEISTMVLFRLGQTQGGVTFAEYAGVSDNLDAVLGRPIVTNNSMNNQNTSSATPLSQADTPDILYGDMSLAAMFGSRMGTQVAVSRERYFDTYQAGLRVTVRHDINVHDVGSTTSASPVTCLFQT